MDIPPIVLSMTDIVQEYHFWAEVDNLYNPMVARVAQIQPMQMIFITKQEEYTDAIIGNNSISDDIKIKSYVHFMIREREVKQDPILKKIFFQAWILPTEYTVEKQAHMIALAEYVLRCDNTFPAYQEVREEFTKKVLEKYCGRIRNIIRENPIPE